MSNIIDLPRTGFQAAVKAILAVWESGGTPYLLGRPGEAKTACAHEAARQYQASEFITLEISRTDPVSLAGYDFPANPEVNDGFAVANKPHWFPRTARPVILLDDYADGAPASRAACYPLLHPTERRCGQWRLPDEAKVVVCSNRASDGALSGTIGTAEAGRVVFINFEQTADEWVDSFGLEHVTPEICAFLQWQPDLFNTFDPRRKGQAFASARSWDQASRLQSVAPHTVLRNLLPGVLGVETAAQFSNFLRLAAELPDLDQVVANPHYVAAPSAPDAKHLVISVLARNVDAATFGPVLTYVKRLGREFTQAFIQSAIKASPSVANAREYVEWTRENDLRLQS